MHYPLCYGEISARIFAFQPRERLFSACSTGDKIGCCERSRYRELTRTDGDYRLDPMDISSQSNPLLREPVQVPVSAVSTAAHLADGRHSWIAWFAGALLLALVLGMAFVEYLSPALLNEIATLAMCV